MVKKHIICIGVTILAFILRVKRLANRELWGDELFEFYQFEGPFIPFWFNDRHTMADHSAFPGEYLLNYPFVQIFGLNKWGIMIPHIIVTLIGFFLLYKLCQIYLKSAVGYTIAFALVCFNQDLIFHSFEFRPYAVLWVLGLGSLYCADQVMLNWDQLNLKKKLLMGLFYCLTCIYHAFGIILFILPVIYAMASRRNQPYIPFFLNERFRYFGTVFLIGFPLWFWYAAFNNFGLGANLFQSIDPTFQFIPNPVVNAVGFFKSVILNLMGGFKPLYIFLPGILVAFFVRQPDKLRQLGFLLILIVIPITCILIMTVMAQTFFVQRYFSLAMPFFALLVAWSCDSIWTSFKAGRIK